MSTPINHHYVSECHLKEFFNEETNHIYLFDKKLLNYYNRPGTKRIFSEDNLNTRLLNNRLDNLSLEVELRVLFEDDFAKHLAAVKKFYEDHSSIENAYEHLNYLAIMALVGEYRNPHYKHGIDEALNAMKNHVKNIGVEIPEEQTHQDVKYQNAKGYIDVARLLLTKMDPLTFALVAIKSNDHFILPDTSAFLVREHLNVSSVIQFGLPVSDKLFILGRSSSMGKYPTTLVETKNDDDELVFKINSDLVNYAYKTVACHNEVFLKKTITKMQQVRHIGQYFHGSTIGSIEKNKPSKQ